MWLKKFGNCVEEWKRREKAFEAGPNIFAQALLTRLFTALVGLALLARMSHFEMSASLCSRKPTPEETPSLRTNQELLLQDACFIVESITNLPDEGAGNWCSAGRGIESRASDSGGQSSSCSSQILQCNPTAA
jgi:hypothetical protein